MMKESVLSVSPYLVQWWKQGDQSDFDCVLITVYKMLHAPKPFTILGTRRVQVIDLPRKAASFGRQILVERGVHKPV